MLTTNCFVQVDVNERIIEDVLLNIRQPFLASGGEVRLISFYILLMFYQSLLLNEIFADWYRLQVLKILLILEVLFLTDAEDLHSVT